ncbi:MAG: PfkB family carbohydrate kinase [Eubacteriales bacterium]|nr:PfkB family carbohydrate kinase [Eubacteriales bacterium]
MEQRPMDKLNTSAAEVTLLRGGVEIAHRKGILANRTVSIPFAQLQGIEYHEKNVMENAYLLFRADGMQEITHSVMSGHRAVNKGRIDLAKSETDAARSFYAAAQEALERFRVRKYVAVCGGVNIDIGGRSFAPLIARDSNPGRVEQSLGGVGRNIAHNLSLLGANVSLLTALGEDAYTTQIERSCEELDIDLSHVLHVPGGRTSTYVFLGDSDGDMALAVSDMEICEELTPSYFAQHLDFLNGAELVIVDTNLPQASLLYLAEHCTAPLFVDPVSVTKAEKLRAILKNIHTLKPNRLEAEVLSGVRICDGESLAASVDELLERGVQRVFLSLGEEGLFAAQGDERFLQENYPAQIKNATGAGDALMAALAWSYLDGRTLRESAKLGAAAASLAVEGEKTINPELCAANVLSRAAQEIHSERKEESKPCTP